MTAVKGNGLCFKLQHVPLSEIIHLLQVNIIDSESMVNQLHSKDTLANSLFIRGSHKIKFQRHIL